MINKQIKELQTLCNQILAVSHPQDKLLCLNDFQDVKERLQQIHDRFFHKKKLTLTELAAIAAICAIKQEKRLFTESHAANQEKLYYALVSTLVEIDKFYNYLGGIVGYQLTVLELVNRKPEEEKKSKYHKPEGVHIDDRGIAIHKTVLEGIASLPKMAEIYPIGGAGDRLNLHSDKDDAPLPAAKLAFCGRSLLCGLIRDLQAREYLHFKLYGNQTTTPIALMTSQEKDNHRHIYAILEENSWYGRPHDSFLFFSQPLVPVITKEGVWLLADPLKLLLKPGGHGVLWKQAKEHGILESIRKKGRSKLLIRQINNPIAGVDNGLLAFIGEGIAHDYHFGFISCPRHVNASEGVLVLKETQNETGKHSCCISNIEYTEFAARGITDEPLQSDQSYSIFPANTNILFGDFLAIEKAIEHCPIPGLLINMKGKYPFIDENGQKTEITGGRLESTMQNISDYMIDSFPSSIEEKDFHQLSTFIVYNERKKTIATTKNSYKPGKSTTDTPEGAFYTMLQNAYELLTKECHLRIPPINSIDDYLENGPSLLFLYHPALGPLYTIIAQKIKGGCIAYNSEMQLEIADLQIENLNLAGSLLIEAEAVIGATDNFGLLKYGSLTGKCVLKNVTIDNKGIDRIKTKDFWKNGIERHESLKIHIKGNGEFYAENVSFKGNHSIEVPDGQRMTAYQADKEVKYKIEKIDKPTWQWNYSAREDGLITLEKTNEK